MTSDAGPSSPPSTERLGRATKDIAFGSIAGMVSKVFEHPFDLVKVRLQTQSGDGPPMYRGALDCFAKTYKGEGVRGLYRGLSMPVLGATLENASLFFTYNAVKTQLRSISGRLPPASDVGLSSNDIDEAYPLPMTHLAVAAAAAGAVTSYILTPIELVKCKMQVQMIAGEAAGAGVTKAGGQAISGGLVASGLKTAAGAGSRPFSTSSSATTAASASSASPPLPRPMEGPLTIVKRVLRTEGVRGLWLGQTGTLLRETGGGVAWFLGFEASTRYLVSVRAARSPTGRSSKEDLTSLELVASGALAGLSYNVVLFPADVVKSTIQTEQELGRGGGAKTGFLKTFARIYAQKGVRGLYAGCLVTCLRSAPSSAIIFLLYSKLEALAKEHNL